MALLAWLLIGVVLPLPVALYGLSGQDRQAALVFAGLWFLCITAVFFDMVL